MLLDPVKFKRCLFLDIETVSGAPDFQSLPDNIQELWKVKSAQFNKSGDQLSPEESYTGKAGIFAEFAKVVCISIGFFHFEGQTPDKIRIKSIAGDNEYTVLHDFARLLINHYNDPDTCMIGGHNIKEFDIPFLCRRMVINGIKIPPILEISGKKPWQIAHFIDTMDMWRFGDFKNYTSLSLLAACLGIPSPKDDIDGSMVGSVFWKEDDLERIVTYCQKDVKTVMQIALRFAGLPPLEDARVEFINQKKEE
jgi:DNA polymerase elongation subunit (family B)